MTAEHRPRSGTLKVGLIGTFDVANYGDCLFPLIYENLIGKERADCAFSYYSPLARSVPIRDYGPVRALPQTLDDIAFEEDVLILCGGETLDLGHSSGTFNFPSSTLSASARLWFAPTVAASRGEVSFIVHSVGMPLGDGQPRPEIARALESATKVSLRDAISARRLSDIFPVETDPVFTLSELKNDAEWKAEASSFLPEHYEAGGYLAAHVSAPYLQDSGLRPWCEQIMLIAEQADLPVLLVPVCHFMNDYMTLAAAREMLVGMGVDERRVQLSPPGSEHVVSTAAILGQAAGIVTSSLHASVTAVSFGRPFATLSGSAKSGGKHRQTMLAAGVNYGLALEVSELAEVYREASRQDNEAARDEAISRAHRDFRPLLDTLANAEPEKRPIPEDAVRAVLERDRRETRKWRFEFKRFLLRVLRRSRIASRYLTARRHDRMVAGLQEQ